MPITLKLVTEPDGCIHFQELIRRVWSSPEDDLVPVHVAITILKNGGALLGAYDPDGPSDTGGMVGAALWWLGTDTQPVPSVESVERDEIDPKAPVQDRAPDPSAGLKVCSHMAGVLPPWQGRGVGLQLKLTQRRLVLRQGLTQRITWTYDPLYLANGVFNIHRLGAICNTYKRNVYGEMQDALNRGVPSDRCQVDWRLRSPRVVQAATNRPPQRAWTALPLHRLPTRDTGNDFRQPVEQDPPLDGAPLAMPIPTDVAAMRQHDPALGLAWRLYTRAVLETAFAAGYSMVDCVQLSEHGWHYILTNEPGLS